MSISENPTLYSENELGWKFQISIVAVMRNWHSTLDFYTL